MTERFSTYEDAYKALEMESNHVLIHAPVVVRDYTSHLAGACGKRLRGRAVLTCSMDAQGTIPVGAVYLGAAVETLHLATLVHDDVIDNADTRRGIATLQKRYGRRIAVICGDYLLCTALRLASQVTESGRFHSSHMRDYAARVCMGELRQECNHGNLNLSVRTYLRIIEGKTAALFEASFYGGAVFATEDIRLLGKYARLGRNIGMTFQLMDDCMDYDGEKHKANKPIHSDYEQGVITLPLIHTLQQDASFREKVRSGRISREELDAAVRRNQGTPYTRLLAGRYYQKASGFLASLTLPQEKERLLREILDKAYYGGKP